MAHQSMTSSERVDTDRVGRPWFLAIVTGTEYGYTLPSGVHIIPIGALTASWCAVAGASGR